MSFRFFPGRCWYAALCLALAAWLPLSAAAQSGAPAPLDTQALQTIVENTIGGKVTSIAPSPVSGLYEVVFNGNIVYIDSSGKYLFDGHLVDVAARTSVTERRKREIEIASTPPMDIAKLDFADAIKTVYGKEVPGRVVVAFEDPRCTFCQRMHQTFDQMPDLVLYTFPVSFLGPESRRMNEVIWCSADRSKAWDRAMKGLPQEGSATGCDLAALERNTALATHYRISGTPTLFTPSGVRVAGAVSAQALEEALRAKPD